MLLIEPTFPPEVQARLDELEGLLAIEPLLAFLDALRDEVQTMPMPRRFSQTRVPTNEVCYMGGTLNPTLQGCTEAEHKRGQLTIDITSVMSRLLSVATDVRNVLQDVEVTKLSDDPTAVVSAHQTS